jgi:hypothetical protein
LETGILALGGAAAIACICTAKRYLEGLYTKMEKQSLAGIQQFAAHLGEQTAEMKRTIELYLAEQTAELKRAIELSQSQ